MDKDKFSAEDRVKELSPKEMQIIDSVMGNPRLYIDAYNDLSRSIYPGIDRKKIETIKKDMDKIDINLNRYRIGKGMRLIIYNKLNNNFLTDLLKKVKKTELLEEGSFYEERKKV